MCCFKGFDEESFGFNTGAAEGFDRQFERFKRYVELGMDLYGYVTLTGPSTGSVESGIPEFMDRLQSISVNLPLRVVPLAIAPFGPMLARPEGGKRAAGLGVQEAAIKLWDVELARRFDVSMRARSIADVPL